MGTHLFGSPCNICFYHFIHVSYTFAEAELEINFNNRLHTKRLASLYFSTSFLTCHKC